MAVGKIWVQQDAGRVMPRRKSRKTEAEILPGWLTHLKTEQTIEVDSPSDSAGSFSHVSRNPGLQEALDLGVFARDTQKQLRIVECTEAEAKGIIDTTSQCDQTVVSTIGGPGASDDDDSICNPRAFPPSPSPNDDHNRSVVVPLTVSHCQNCWKTEMVRIKNCCLLVEFIPATTTTASSTPGEVGGSLAGTLKHAQAAAIEWNREAIAWVKVGARAGIQMLQRTSNSVTPSNQPCGKSKSYRTNTFRFYSHIRLHSSLTVFSSYNLILRKSS
ncbi:hypothetical protein V8E53_006279 [Lactarius tabidus]